MKKKLDKPTNIKLSDILREDDINQGIQELLSHKPVGMLVVYSDMRGFHAMQIGELNIAEVVGMGAMLKNWTEDVLYDVEDDGGLDK